MPKAKEMLLNCEQWRKDFGVDDLIQCAPRLLFFFASSHRCPHPRLSNFDFKEKAAVDKYYPQYYHKMDIVRPPVLRL